MLGFTVLEASLGEESESDLFLFLVGDGGDDYEDNAGALLVGIVVKVEDGALTELWFVLVRFAALNCSLLLAILLNSTEQLPFIIPIRFHVF